MLLVTELLRWWYGDGLLVRLRLIANRLEGTMDYFSIGFLVKTLFAPFRQISAGRVDGPLGVQFRAMIDRLFSRVIGAFVRIIILLVGGVMIGVQALLGLLFVLVWLLVPLLPIVGFGLLAAGVTL